MKDFDLRKYLAEGRLLKENSFKKEEYKYLKITPEEFKAGDLFLMAPEDEGEFFDHKEATKISSITLPRDGRGNTAFIETEEGEKKLSVSSLYNIARKKYLAENKLLKENINLEDALDKFESLEDEFSYNPSIDGIQEIGNFIDFLRERHPNGVGYEVDLDAEFTAFDESEYEPSYKTHVDINNYISFLGEYGNETFLEEKKMEY